MGIYQGDIGIHDIKLGNIDVFEIYQGSKLVYPENTEITITFKLNVSGTVTINGYTPVISENNTKFVFTIPVKTNYTAIISAEHYKSQTINGNGGYLPITHNVELEWEQRFISYTVTFPTDGVKVLFDGIEKGVITNGKLVVLIDDTEAKDSYTVTFKGSKTSIYDTSTLAVVNSSIANTGGVYDLKLPTSSVKSGYKRIDYASSTGSITKGSTYAGTWIEIVVNLTASFTSSTTLGSISNNVLTIPNNESTNTKSGTLSVVFTLENKQTKKVSAALNQAAGAKVYTDWVLDLQTDGTSVEAKGGTRTITANVARRTYKWNNTGTVYSETATPTLSISGSASLSENQIKFTSNESVSVRSATLTASYVGLSKTVTITQQAGAKVYSAWSAWAVSISASTQTIGASGGSSTITTNASRSRTWTWNGVGTTYTDTETATPTLSGSAGGFTLSGKTVTASNNTTTNSRSIIITATSNSVSKSITITQSAGAKVYSNWSSWTVNISADKTSIGATGGTATITTNASRSRTWTWNGVGTTYTDTETATPTLSGSAGGFTLSGKTVTASNNTTTNSRSIIITATSNSVSKSITITQSAGAKVYSNWSSWTVNISADKTSIGATGGTATITTNASRSRTWTWNGVGTTYTDTETATPTLSGSAGGFTLSGKTVTASNNTTTNSRSIIITATSNSVSKSITITQSAGAKVYSNWSSWTVNISADKTSIGATGGTATITTNASRSRTWTWNGVGTTYTDTETATPTLSGSAGGFTLSGKTVTASNNTTTNSRSIIITATSNSVSKSITITQSAGAKVYSNWSSWTVNISADKTSIGATGGTATITTNASRSRTWTWNGVGTTYTDTETATPTLSGSAGGFTLSGKTVTASNNTTTNSRSIIITATSNSVSKSITITQSAGAKVYSNWSSWTVNISADKTSIGATGGTATITTNASRSRTWTWNGVGTTYTDTETATPTLSGSAGGFTLSGKTVTASNNTTTNSRSIIITATSNSVSKSITITQSAGAKVYSNWSSWTVNISADKTSIGATGGTATITTNASRSRTWTWNGVGTTYTDTETATPTLSGSAGGFTLSGKTVTASNNTTTNSRSIIITATSNSVSKSITITQSAGAKVYSNWSSWTVNISADKTSIGATGGTATISTSASRTRSYTWNGVAGSGGTETGNGSPTLSKVSGSGNWTSPKVTYGNNTSTSGKSTVIRATIDSVTKDITINQSAGAKQYSAWSAWTVNISNSGNVAASGGSSNITTSASRTRTWTWNGVSGSGGTETGTGTPTLSKVSGAGSFASNKVSYDNNTSTSARSTVIRATMDSVTKDTTVTQNAGAKTYSSWGAWSISLSANVTTIAAAGGNATLSTSATRSRTWQWNGTGATYTENASGSPTLSKVNGAASLSGSTVSYGNNTSTSSRSSVFRATIDSVTKDITINQSAGSKSYGSWSSWSVYCNASSYTVAASGGSVTIYYGASRSRTWTWNGVAGSGGTETENATPSLSAGSGGGTLSGSTLSYSNNTSTSVRRTRVTANYNGAINFCDIEQRAGSKVYGSWSGWSVSISASPTNIAAAGGSSTITCSAVRSRQYTWNGVGQNFPETENGSPTLSKSGDGTLNGTTSGSKLTYDNRTTTTSRSTTVTATYSGVSKSINVTQSAGSRSYGAKVYHTKYYGTNPDGNGLDFTGYPCTNEIDTIADANTISVSVYYRLYTAQPWTWNGVAGSGGTELVYYNPDHVNVTNKVNCDVSVANAFNYDSMIIVTFKLSANDSNTAREYKIEWNWLNHNVITKGTQRANPVLGRLVIKNDYFTSQNIALPIYLDSKNVDSIYRGEASYNDIEKTPISVYVYIPTNISIMNAGKLQFWFENKDGGGSKYTCTLSNVSTPSNNVSVSNSNNIISVTANTTTSSFTILCQFTITSNSTVFNVRVLIEP